MEQAVIMEAYKKEGTPQKAADYIGMRRNTYKVKLEKYGLD